MNGSGFGSKLAEIVGSDGVLADEPLAAHTTFKIGGPAQWLVLPRTEQQVVAVVALCREAGVPWRVLGAGSNVLAPDEGLPGVVVKLAQNFAGAEVLPGGELRAQTGATNEAVAAFACENGLSGYEFACGIPGTIGGAAYMNAGAYDGQFSDVCVSVRCLTDEGEILEVPVGQAQFGYRHSLMMEKGWVILEATLGLRPGSAAEILTRMDDLRRRREEKQPLEMPSAGSTFKRPEGHFAGKLIQDAGCQGRRVGGAQVSEKHAGFVVNTGGATAQDVLALIAEVQMEVKTQFGVDLEPEVRLWE
ncbi:UDP-N-acetylmuramate dehydrogenase [Parvibacter caecicola]|uniref:UDP-N-acetylenolpyruvoylglucosamine reductase n=1 Tax=Parvibacter caecicola TaxID=747645 RepID=A0A7W5D3A1_9ACTN|nr:UDP-N-acetylmuramate dehydrogenase [Parvibacter caecicola]MBB3171935.1 UDP-N-acetylmuramate dehydrogenase [Parvibacter caecicola]MCR2041127.1 UDP-N-acetylmuramate dehydrogenase [Parvibacter caecicola]RNL11677.1 UDP-N-acetylenolpyruvoylglucosamine reductase [Parvibacter caecicola]